MPVVKSGTKRMSISQILNVTDDMMVYGRLEPKRPTVIRIRDKVKKCFLYEGTGDCLGSRCFWPTVGTCSTFNRLKSKRFKKSKSKVRGKRRVAK